MIVWLFVGFIVLVSVFFAGTVVGEKYGPHKRRIRIRRMPVDRRGTGGV